MKLDATKMNLNETQISVDAAQMMQFRCNVDAMWMKLDTTKMKLNTIQMNLDVAKMQFRLTQMPLR